LALGKEFCFLGKEDIVFSKNMLFLIKLIKNYQVSYFRENEPFRKGYKHFCYFLLAFIAKSTGTKIFTNPSKSHWDRVETKNFQKDAKSYKIFAKRQKHLAMNFNFV
jgi:hypothetical protein